MALIKIKLLEPHIDRDGRYLRADTVVDWDDTKLNTSQIPAPNLGAATTTATTAFGTAFGTPVNAPIPGQPQRYKRG